MPARATFHALSIAAGIAVVVGSSVSQDSAPGDVVRETIPGTRVAFEMAFVPDGVFELGSPVDETDRDDDEGPVRRVRIEPFWMGVHEITHDEFAIFRYRRLDDHASAAAELPFDADAVSRPSPPYEDPAHGMSKNGHPAVGMTRWAALQYSRWLSTKTGRLYRLPTEAEWEYACQAGEDRAYGFNGASGELGAHAWLADNSRATYQAVGLKAPNAWRLRDMHGNVAEWVADRYDEAFYASLPDGEPVAGPISGLPGRGQGVVRGGSYIDGPADARCAARSPETPYWKRRDPQIPKSRWWNTDSEHVGFRIVRPAREVGIDEIRAYWNTVLGP